MLTVHRQVFTRLSGVVSRIALGLRVRTVACGDMKYRTAIFSNCLLLGFRGGFRERSRHIVRSFGNIVASQYFKNGLGGKYL